MTEENPFYKLDVRCIGSQKKRPKKQLEEEYALVSESIRMHKQGIPWSLEYAEEFLKKLRAERRLQKKNHKKV